MSGTKIDIHTAAGEGNLGEVKAFLKAGGMIDRRDQDRWTPLMFAVREGHLEVARQLLRSGAALEAKDGDKWTAMHVAAANGHPQCCQLLLDRGGNPRAVDENKRTPLHWATRYGYAAVVELLLKRGADANFRDAEEKTPGDVIGNDLTEDSSVIVRNLLKEHAERGKANKQRRGSCPAIPRTAMVTAVNASNGTTVASVALGASPSPSSSLKRPSALLPLPSVLVAKTELIEASPDREELPAVGDIGKADQPFRHTSFSVAAHIRDHPSAGKNQGRSIELAPPDKAEFAGSSSAPPPAKTGVGLALPTSSGLPQTLSSKGSPEVVGYDAKESVVEEGIMGGSSHGEEDHEGAGQRDGDTLCEVAKLRLALRKAEERARLSELLLSEAEKKQLREEARARCLEQRVTELEKLL
ncbi:unnamed protein product, partial [Hapterophycus canaliculatus]